jgi:hypothetical protein
MTIYDDGVAGETIDMTLVLTKEDMHKLMIKEGFEKMSEAEIKLKEQEKTQLFAVSTKNKRLPKVERREVHKRKQKQQGEQRANLRLEKKQKLQRQKEDREILGISAVPSYIFQAYAGGVAGMMLIVVYASMRRQRRRKHGSGGSSAMRLVV